MTDRRSFPRALALVMGAFIALGLLLFSVSVAGATQPNPDHKVTLCHRTGSASNPYVEVTVDIASSGYVKGGHTGHNQIGNGLGGDIIPAYQYVKKDGSTFTFTGKNLGTLIMGTTGLTILNNGCQLIDTSTPKPSASASATPSATPEPSTSSPASPSASVAPSVAPSTPVGPIPNTAVSGPGDIVLPILGLGTFLILGLITLVALERRRGGF